jgi:GNAT superfamily N-acetyltransferase
VTVRTISFMYETATVSLIDWGDGTGSVSSLYSQTRRQGHATGLMRILIDYADANGIKLMLTADPYSEDGPNLDQLITFYEGFGFRAPTLVPGVPTFMERMVMSQELHGP